MTMLSTWPDLKKIFCLKKKKDICGCALALNIQWICTFYLVVSSFLKSKLGAKEAYLEFFNKIKKLKKKSCSSLRYSCSECIGEVCIKWWKNTKVLKIKSCFTRNANGWVWVPGKTEVLSQFSLSKMHQCYITLSQYLPECVSFRMGMGQLPACSFQCCHNSVDPLIETTELCWQNPRLFQNTVITKEVL